jgi:hypothetical protein
LIAALKVKMQRPEAVIAYVRQQNKQGDTRHPMRRLSSESPQNGDLKRGSVCRELAPRKAPSDTLSSYAKWGPSCESTNTGSEV